MFKHHTSTVFVKYLDTWQWTYICGHCLTHIVYNILKVNTLHQWAVKIPNQKLNIYTTCQNCYVGQYKLGTRPFSANILIFKLVFFKSCIPMFFRSGFRISQYNNYHYRCRLLFPETLLEPVLSFTLYNSLVQSLIHLNAE